MPEFFGRRIYLILFGLIFISMVILTIHFREGEDGLIHRTQRGVMAATSPLQSAVITALTPVRDGWDYLIHFGQLKRENRQLKQEVAGLKSRVFELQSLKNENARLRNLIGFKDKVNKTAIAAHVIGMPASNWWASIIVDRGSASGVKRNMAVVAGGGLIGQIADVSENVSKVILLNDVQSGVSVQVQRTGEVGVIRGQLKERKLNLQYISRDSTIKKGDVIVTSGLGGIFPRGIYVGQVSSAKQSTYSLYKMVEVAPPTDFLNLNEVLIIDRGANFSFEESN